MNYLIPIGLYILSVYVNRWLYHRMVMLDENFYPNPMAMFMIFVPIFGTIVLSIIVIVETLTNIDDTKNNWFKPKN